MKKHILSLILVVCLLCSLLPTTVFATNVIASGVCGDELTWELDEGGTLIISGTGPMYDWGLNDHDMPWYDQRESITSIVISEGVTTIGEAAFYDCINLYSVIIPKTIHTIQTFAFYRCTNLTEIYIPAEVSKIGNYVFVSCENLSSIDVSDDNESFCSIDGILYDKKAEVLITWPGGKGNEEIFDGCKTIKQNAIYECNEITELTIPASVTLIEGNSIKDCDNITSITIEKDPVIKYLAIGSLKSLESFYVNEKSTCYSSVDGVLYNKDQTVLIRCPETRKSISIASNVVELADEAFYRCRYLSEFDIPTSVQKIGKFAFSACRSLIELKLPANLTYISDYLFANSDALQTLIIPASVTKIGTSAFAYCDSLRHILFEGTQEQWNNIEKADTKLSDDVLITYNYSDEQEYHVYSDPNDTECDVCGQFRLVGCIGQKLGVEITTSSDYDYNLTGEGSEYVSARLASQTSVIIGTSGTYCKGYELIFSQPGTYELTFVQDKTGSAVSFSALISDHVWNAGIITKEATETETGIISYTCQRCAFTKEDSIPKLEHTHKYTGVVTAPTCLEKGFTTYTCSCGDAYIADEVAALGHNEVIDAGYEASCTATGLTDGKHCDRCNTVLVEQQSIAALGHSWDEGNVTTQPSETSTGIKTYTCQTCGETRAETIPALDHTHIYEATVTTPTCTGVGYTTYTCSCGDTYTDDEVTALGHNEVIDKGYAATCTEDGLTDGKHCDRCELVLIEHEVILSTGHDFEDGNCDRCGAKSVSIKTQPKTNYAKMGENVKVTVKAEGDGLTYQWYIKNAGGSKYSKSSITSATYSTKMSGKSKGRRVYCVITDAYGNKVQTKTVMLREAVSIVTEPKTGYAKSGKTVKVSVEASGDELTYQWYIKNAGSSKYSKSSITSATYSAKMSDKVHGRRVYCVVTDKYGKTVQTKTVILRMAATITTQPKNVTVAEGKTAKVTVKAVGEELTYQWYIKNTGKDKFSKSSVTKSTYSVKMSDKVDGRQIYCVVTDKYGKTVKTNTVTLTMK